MNNNTEKRICTVESCNNEQHSKGLCRKHYRLKNMKYCGVDGCTNVHYARNYCSRHYRTLYRKEVCKVEDCGKPVNTRGYCTKHYRRFMKYGDTSIVRSKKIVGTCKAKGCSRKIDSLGYCTKHYQRFRRHGTTSSEALSRNMEHDGKCSIKGCNNNYYAKSMCNKHYKRYRRYGCAETLKALPNTIAKTCKIEECNDKHFGRGYCEYHYYRSDYHKQKSHRYRARKLKAPINDFDKSMIRDIKKYFNNSCGYCGIKLEDYHIEHVTPLSRGGSHTKSNIITSCPACNYNKNTSTLEEWYPKQTFYSIKRESRILKWIGCEVSDDKIQLQLF